MPPCYFSLCQPSRVSVRNHPSKSAEPYSRAIYLLFIFLLSHFFSSRMSKIRRSHSPGVGAGQPPKLRQVGPWANRFPWRLCHGLCHNPPIPTHACVSGSVTRLAQKRQRTRAKPAWTLPLYRFVISLYLDSFALGNGMEEVVGSIPTRSTNRSNNLDRASVHRQSVCVMVCVITYHFAAFGRASIALRLASMRTWLYRSSIFRLTCPAIAMMVESDAPLSASDVIAQCRRSWKRKPGSPAFFVRVRQADRQLLTCVVGSNPVTLYPQPFYR